MAELTTPSLANMRSMMAELFVWKENETVLRELKKRPVQSLQHPIIFWTGRRGLWYCGILWEIPNAPASQVKSAGPHQMKFFPFACAKAGNFHVQANWLLLWTLWCWKDTLTRKGNTKQNYFIQKRGQSQAPGSQHRAFLLFSQDIDLWQYPQIRANVIC